MTTYAQFIAALTALTVTGVSRKYTEPPKQVGTADLPVMYPRLPEGGDRPMTADGQGGWPTLSTELVILVEPYAQNLQATNFAATVTMIDNLNTALRGATLTKAKHSWQIRRQAVAIDSGVYWAFVVTVTGNG